MTLFPPLAVSPSRSIPPGRARARAASSTKQFPGPTSKADTTVPPSPRSVTFAIPPMFSITVPAETEEEGEEERAGEREREGEGVGLSEARAASKAGTRGAPLPPAATSAARKFPTTSVPSVSAKQASSPSCRVALALPVSGSVSCQTVCPCEPTAATAPASTPTSASTLAVALAMKRPAAQ